MPMFCILQGKIFPLSAGSNSFKTCLILLWLYVNALHFSWASKAGGALFHRESLIGVFWHVGFQAMYSLPKAQTSFHQVTNVFYDWDLSHVFTCGRSISYCWGFDARSTSCTRQSSSSGNWTFLPPMILSRVSVQRDPTFHTRLANCVQNLCDHAQNSVSEWLHNDRSPNQISDVLIIIIENDKYIIS